MPTARSERSSAWPRVVALALLAGALLAVSLAAPPAGAAATKHACHGRHVRVRVGAHRACVKLSAPARNAAAQQRAFDRALLASRLHPRHGSGHGRTIRAWLGRARKGLTAVERRLAHAGAARAAVAATGAPGAAAAAGWKTSEHDHTPGGATGLASTIIARHGDAKLTLDSSYVAKVQNCPDAAGEDPGTRTRKISLKLDVPLTGGRTLTVRSSQSTTASFVGRTNDDAALATILMGKVKTKASARGELRDRHGKLLARLSPMGVHATITLPTALGTTVSWPEVLTDPATAFVASGALKALVRGDGASLDPLLRRFVMQMQTDAWSTYDQARGALLDAQHAWWQAGRCLYLALETPSGDHVAGGAHLPVRATAILTSEPKHPKHKGVGALPLRATASEGTITPASAKTKPTSAGQADPLVFDYTAANRAGNPTVTVSITSKQGTASASVPLTVTATDVYYRVTAVSGSIDYTASYTDGNPPQCAVSGAEHSVAGLDSGGHLGATDGRYHAGGFSLDIPVRWTGSIDFTAGGVGGAHCAMEPSCHADVDESGGPVASAIAADGASNLDVEIIAPAPHAYSGCYAGYKDPFFPGISALLHTSAPIATITSGKPFSLSWEQTASAEGHTITRRLTATVTPVDAEGRPLS